ncbi:MAG TPA: GAF domain-containing protein [Longimicrobium sp.]|nr:GAF domain-containing protein [Longimicrobium sp.]
MSASLSTEDLFALLEANRTLAQEVNLRDLMASVLETANRLTDSVGSSVMLYDEAEGKLYFAHATGPHAEMLLERWGRDSQGVPLEKSSGGEAFRTGQTLVVNAVQADPQHFKEVDADTGKATESMISTPLEVLGKRIGVVQIVNKRAGSYDQRDVGVLEHVASQAAIAIRNARLFDALLAHMGLYSAAGHETGPVELLEQVRAPARNETMSVLFADMRGFTQLCHLISRPEKTQELLNEFLSMLANAVLSHGGLVNKFLGDGLLALFRDGAHAERAVRCAWEMVSRFHAMRDRWDATNNVSLGFLDVGVGITSDSVIIGSIGSERVRDFTAVGTSVNLAASLMNQARDGRRILTDKMTFLAARHLIASYKGPEPFELKKPGQTVGHPYQRYVIETLHDAGDVPASAASAPAQVPPRQAGNDVFISYSHRDAAWLGRLQVHLKPYLRTGTLTAWDDTRIDTGDEWRAEIANALASARLAVLLVSPDFLNSDFIATDELPPLLDAAAKGGMKVFWVPVSASSYDETPIGRYQAALDPARPLKTMSEPEQDEALVRVCKDIKRALSGSAP